MTTSPPMRLLRCALLFTIALLLPASAATAASVPLFEPGAEPLRLTGGLDRFDGGIPVPAGWDRVSGEVRLAWTGSPELVGGSQLRVSAGGRILGVTDLAAGPGARSFAFRDLPLPRNAMSLGIVLETRLRVRDAVCPTPDHLGAYVQFATSSAVRVTGRWSKRTPRLRNLPQALVTETGRQPSALLVDFRSPPTPAAIRAAAIAAGEVAAVAPTGVRVRVSQPGERVAAGVTESTIEIAEGGMPQLSVKSGTTAPVVRITGQGEALLRAAGALRPSVVRARSGTTITDPPAVRVTRKPLPRRIKLAAARHESYRGGDATSTFELPVHLEALRVARLRLAVGYDAPRGGRATVLINGRELQNETLGERGRSRFTVEEELAPRGPALNRADLRAGRNEVTVRAQFDVPRDLCTAPGRQGSLSTNDYGSVTLLTRERPVLPTLTTFPYPLSRNPGWNGATVRLPQAPTGEELGAVIGTLAGARRVTGEPAMPAVQLGGGLPQGHVLYLARRDEVPRELAGTLAGPAEEGVLASSGDAGGVRILAIGTRALRPLAREYSIGAVEGRVAQALPGSEVAIRLADAERVTGVQRGPVPWRWPLLVIAAAAIGLLLMLIVAAARRIRRTA